MKYICHLVCVFSLLLITNHAIAQSLPSHTTEYKGLWVTKFKSNVLGNTLAENELLTYAQTYGYNYLICTNMYQILTANCGSFTTDMNNLRLFIEKAHNEYGISRISGNVGSAATATKIKNYNNCASVSPAQRLDMITYECEFYNPSTNGSCPGYASFISQLNTIKSITTSTSSSSGGNMVCEVYIGGSGSTGLVVTNSSESEMKTIASTADQVLLTYYRSSPSSSGGNFFNWTIQRLQWLASSTGSPNSIVLLLKSRNTDTNNMNSYLNTYPGSHSDAIIDPYYSWTEGNSYNPSLTKGYVEKFEDGTYPWLSGIKVKGFTWFENEANQSMVTLPLSLLEFTANAHRDKTVAIEWRFDEGSSFRECQLEYSIDGIHWQYLYTSTGNAYQDNYNHYPLPSSKIYYRLKITDQSLRISYSKIQSVQLSNIEKQDLSLYPNPSNGHFKILGIDKKKEYIVNIFNHNGQWVAKQSLNSLTSKDIQPWDNQLPGMYYIQILDRHKVVDWKKIVIMP
ncbi:T9SS type A sorting domain-containing protein [Membranihabitans marinus]|uniref:T9SS type A sorting domain-containing protein n=1 Tax=Membranihabitans marinus TaxID=1227546 RepID=UPI001F43C0CC|nr:T9SS type A sorting domain-containing protein [Membranihabitans marinus]